MISESFLQDQRFLKYRSLILRSIAASVHLLNTKQVVNGDANDAEKTTLQCLINQLQEHHQQVLKEEVNYKALHSPIQGPYRSRLTLYTEHGQLMIGMFTGVASLHQNHSLDEMNKAGQLYTSLVDKVLKKAKPTQLVKEDFLEDILNTIEVCFSTKKVILMNNLNFLAEWQYPLHPLQRLPKNHRSFAQ